MTGLFTERGIHKADGFLSEFAVEKEQYVVKVPPTLRGMAVLTEPVSIAEKAIEQIRTIQSRLPWTCQHPEHSFLSPEWGGCKTALVVGAGPLGLLTATLLRLAKVNTIVADILPHEHPKARLVDYIGAKYVDARAMTSKQVMEYCEASGSQVNIIVEASGAAATALELANYMARSSIYVMTGIPPEGIRLNTDVGQFIRQIVRFNQVIVGSVNSNRTHFENALKDLEQIRSRYPELHKRIVTNRVNLDEYEKAFNIRGLEQVKTVIQVEG
jgi:threonine dehydrogenase-like Zn-dependent dehydrogenase